MTTVRPIDKVAVIGAGVMGAGIAAHFANAGADVLLLDRVADGAQDRSTIARGAVQKLLKTDPAPLMHKSFAKRITPGNTEDDLESLRDCDWVVEAVLEDLAVKRSLYRAVCPYMRDDAVLSSNTSTLLWRDLADGLPDGTRSRFLITHFFNPPRYMRLMELVAPEAVAPQVIARVADFADRRLGKSVVSCRDTPGFIANRLGAYWLQVAVLEAMDRGVTVEEADAAMGPALGFPRMGVFGLLDLVGLDLMPHVLDSLQSALGADDPFQDEMRDWPLLRRLIAEGYTGRKGKGGFYRLDPEAKGQDAKIKQALNLTTGTYHKAAKVQPDGVSAARKGGPRALLDHRDRAGRYARAVMLKTLAYAARILPEVQGDPDAVDRAMCHGYNWKWGPFELIDRLGPGWLADALHQAGMPVPAYLERLGREAVYDVQAGRLHRRMADGASLALERAEGTLLLADIKRASKPLATNRSASVWDIGDGVFCLEFHSKMNTVNPFTFAMINKALDLAETKGKALVIYNEGSHFCAGANIGLVPWPARLGLWGLIAYLVGKGQKVYGRLQRARVPVVSAPSGLALGGGCELLLHSHAVQAHAESYIGLVEAGIGLLPGWGGCKELLLRWAADPKAPKGPMPPVTKAFETIATAQVAKSAFEARDHLFLRLTDGITLNRDRLLADAKAKALALAVETLPLPQRSIKLPGAAGQVALRQAVGQFRRRGLATAHDETVSAHLARVLCGGEKDHLTRRSEQDLLALEREQFMVLVKMPETQARIRHLLKTGKPLRN